MIDCLTKAGWGLGRGEGEGNKNVGLAEWDPRTPGCPESSSSLGPSHTWVALCLDTAPSLDRHALVLGEFSSQRPRRHPEKAQRNRVEAVHLITKASEETWCFNGAI